MGVYDELLTEAPGSLYGDLMGPPPGKKPKAPAAGLYDDLMPEPSRRSVGWEASRRRQVQEEEVSKSHSAQSRLSALALGIPFLGPAVASVINPEARNTGLSALDAISGAAAESFTKPYYDFVGRKNLGAEAESLLSSQVQQRAQNQGRDIRAESQPGPTAEELWQARQSLFDPQDKFANQRIPKMSREDVRYEQAGLDPEVFGQRAVDLKLGAIPQNPRKESAESGLWSRIGGLLGDERQTQEAPVGGQFIQGSAKPIPTMYETATSRGSSPVEGLAWEVLADPLEMTGLGALKLTKGGKALRAALGTGDAMGEALADGIRAGTADIRRLTETAPRFRGVPGKSARQMQQELRQARADGVLDDLVPDENDRFSYEEDAPQGGKSIAQMRAEMRRPLPPEPVAGGKSASQLRAEMAQGTPVRTVPEMNPDLATARPIQNDLREAAQPQREMALPGMSVEQMEDLRGLPKVDYPAPPRPPELPPAPAGQGLLDDLVPTAPPAKVVDSPKAAPAQGPKLAAVPEKPKVVDAPGKPSWQQPTPKNVDKWKTTVAQHEAITEPKIRQAVAAGGDEAQWRAHYRELEPSSVRFARQGLEEAYAPRISPKTWTEKFAPGAIRVEANGKVTNVLLSLEERQMWKFQSPAERQATLESRALGAKATPREHLYAPPKEGVSEEDLAQEAGVFEGPKQSRPGKQLEEFRARRAAEKPPTPEEVAKQADRAARQDEFHRRSLELVQAHTPVARAKGKLKAEAMAFDEQGRPHVDMGQRRYYLTDGEAKYYNDLPADVDKTEWLRQRQFEPKTPQRRAYNARPEDQLEMPEAGVDKIVPEGSPIKGKPVRGRGPQVPERAPEATAPKLSPEPERFPDPEPVPESPKPAKAARQTHDPADQGTLESLDPDTIQVDAKTYQFKAGGDAKGVTGKLKGVPQWDPVLSGKAVVHERLDGTRYIVDGHQRLGLAQRAKAAGQEGVMIDAQVFREADGWTPGEMRKVAALKNIAEDSGTAIDAAKVIREAGPNEARLKNIPRTSVVMRDGEQLAKLSDPAFESVVNGTVKPDHAAHVGRMIEDPAEQIAALKALRKYNPKTSAEAESIVQDLRVAGFAKRNEGLPDGFEQGGLFGDEDLHAMEDLIGERSKVMDGAARKIKDDKALFNKLVKGEGRASEVGNKLDKAANEARLTEDEQILEALKQHKYVGPVADALNASALGLRNGATPEKAIGDFLEAVRKELGGSGGPGGKLGRSSLEAGEKGPRVGLDFEPDAPGAPATGWDAARPPQSIGNKRLTAAQREQWPDLTAAERKEMLGIKPGGPKVGMDFAPEQMELGYKVGGEEVKLGHGGTVKELPVPALVRFVKETTGNYPNPSEALKALGKKLGGTVKGRVTGRLIELNPDIIADVTKLAKVLAHEIGHLPDLLPWASKGINGGIGSLRKGMRGWLKGLPADVRRELWEASKHWRPIDEARASAGQLRYRKDVEETFADAVSMMFNDPERLQKMAPKFWKQFTEQLDKAPKLKQSIADVHAWRSGTLQDLSGELRQQIRTDMVKGADLFKALQGEAKLREQSLIFRLHQNWMAKAEVGFGDLGGVFKGWADELERQGLTVPEHIDPRIHYDEYQFTDGPTAKVAQEANEGILQPLREAEIDEHLAGEWLQNQAIADGHRANMANPRGVTEKEAKEILRQIEKDLTPEQIKTLRGSAKKARELFWGALEEAQKAGRLDKATLARLERHKDSLAPMLELNKLHESVKLEDTLSSIETGSFEEAANPLIGLVQQTLAIRQMARRNKARLAMLDFVKKFAPEEILPATGRPRKGSTAFPVYRDGVKETHHVDQYLEDLFQVTSTRELDGLAKGLDVATGAFQKVWIRWRPDFYLAQGVMDVFKSARNLAAVGLYNAWDPSNVLRVVASYKDAFKPALDYAREVPNDVISKMIDEMALLPADLSITNQMAGDALDGTGQLDAILRQVGVNTQAKALNQGNVFRQIYSKLGSAWTGLGRFSEALPKVAAFNELSKSDKISPAYRANIVRTKIGQPGNYVRGKYTRSSNRFLTFSNTILQDMRSNYHLIRRPSTRGGFAVSTVKNSFIPKLLIAGAGAGWFGAELKEAMDAIPDRDKRNSLPMPFGWDDEGNFGLAWEKGGEFGKRLRYVNVPMDPTDKLFGALFYEALTGNGKEAQDRLRSIGETVGGNVPGVNPTLSGLKNWTQATFGGDPQDSFGRDILSRDEAAAGLGSRWNGTLRWQVGEFGKPGQMLQGAIWDENLGQKTTNVAASVPFMDRFFKTSDAGFAESQRAEETASDREKARGRLAYGDNTRELRQQTNRLAGLSDRTPQQDRAYQGLKQWKAMYDQQAQWIDMLESRGQKAQAAAARARLESMSLQYMRRFQVATSKKWK